MKFSTTLLLLSLFIFVSYNKAKTPAEALLMSTQRAHKSALRTHYRFTGSMPLLTLNKNAVAATLNTITPAMFVGAVIGVIATGSNKSDNNIKETVDITSIARSACIGTGVGLALGACSYKLWQNYFVNRFTTKAQALIQETSPETCRATLRYIQTKTASDIARDYFTTDKKAVHIVEELLRQRSQESH